VWHLLDALKRFDSLDPRRVMEITFEVARLGESGLDYANPEKKYTLSAYPGESFSGLQLMCLMYAGFKRIAPEPRYRLGFERALDQSSGVVQRWLSFAAIKSERFRYFFSEEGHSPPRRISHWGLFTAGESDFEQFRKQTGSKRATNG
jgi:hypothetical protein